MKKTVHSTTRFMMSASLCLFGLLISFDAYAIPGLSSVGKTCVSQVGNGNAGTIFGISTTLGDLDHLAATGSSSLQNGVEGLMSEGLTQKTCESLVHGSLKMGEVGVIQAEAAGTLCLITAEVAGVPVVATGSTALLTAVAPIGIAYCVGYAGQHCIEYLDKKAEKDAYSCMDKDFKKLNDHGFNCSIFDKMIHEKKKMLPYLDKDATTIINEQISELEARKQQCKNSRDAIRDAVGVGYCGELADHYSLDKERPDAPGLVSDYMIMRCESILKVFCSKSPQLAKRRERMKTMLRDWNIEYVHCGQPLASPTPYNRDGNTFMTESM
jgi:hypothetical protein